MEEEAEAVVGVSDQVDIDADYYTVAFTCFLKFY